MSQEYIEVKEKNLQDAITSACRKLSVTSDRLDYEVIDPGKTGFLGFNSRPAVIRARVKASAEETQKVLNDVLAKAEKKSAPKAQEVKKETKKEEKQVVKEIQKSAEPEKTEAAEEKKQTEDKNTSENVNKKRRNRHRKQRSDRQNEKVENKENSVSQAPRAAKEKQREDAANHREPRKKHQERPQLSDEQIKDVKTKADGFLKEVFEAMKMDVTITSVYDKENAVLNVDMAGDDMGVLIGKRGQTLDSLQYLVSLVINKNVDGYIHVKADTENYRERRKKTLENLARNISSKVKRTGKSVKLEPMNPYERRIIHSALQNDRYVTTYSEGEEPYRSVVVVLKK